MTTPQKTTPTGLAAGVDKGLQNTVIVPETSPTDKRSPKQKREDAAVAAKTMADAKRFATLAARAALAGQCLTQTTTGYVLSRWTCAKHCDDLDAVENLLSRAEGLSGTPTETEVMP